MNSFVFLRKPEVPGFCPAIGEVEILSAFKAPSPRESVRSKDTPFTSPVGISLASSLLFTTETSPTIVVFLLMRTRPFTVKREQFTREGMPAVVASSSAPTSLYFLLSREITGAFPPHAGLSSGMKSELIEYASLLNNNKSLHFFTGAKRVRGTTIAEAPWKHSIAAPIAVSSCTTFCDEPSLGSTVLLFKIMGKGMNPPNLSMISFNLSSLIHKLFVLKKRCFVISWKAGSSSSAHMADSRRISCLSDLRTAR
mmetsp:Transcript_22411/g.34186  ORF Transcript_22411/g.34186 Transcript_22411/m.34186 type:complete len:254 (-) Transcript_22411:839-1600(-)